MRSLFLITGLLFSLAVSAQQDKTIKIYATTVGKEVSTKLLYSEIVMDKTETLQPGKFRCYVNANDSCAVVLSRSPRTDAEATEKLRTILSDYTIEYYFEGKRVEDCASFSSTLFPISIVVR